MRILHVARSLSEANGGPSFAIVELADAQARLGHDVYVLSGDSADGVRPALAKVATAPVWGGQVLSMHAAYLDVGRRLAASADLIHVHGIWGAASMFGAHVRSGAVRLLSPHGSLQPEALAFGSKLKGLYLKGVERANLSAFDWVVAASELERTAVERVTPTSVRVLPHGVPLPPRDGLHADGPSGVFGFLGRVVPYKRVGLLLEALVGTDFRLRIAGPLDHVEHQRLLTLGGALGVAERVEFLGPLKRKQLPDFFHGLTALCLCSVSENFGRVAAEALVHARPVIATENLPWGALEREGVGCVVPATGRGIAAGMRKLSDAGSWRVVCERARDYGVRGFSNDELATRLCALANEQGP